MRILFRQASKSPIFEQMGIKNCCFKLIDLKSDRAKVTYKEHYHTCLELHVLLSGEQVYRVGEVEYRLKKGDILFFPSSVRHCAVKTETDTLKLGVMFELTPTSPFTVPDRVLQTVAVEGLSSTVEMLREDHTSRGGGGSLYEAYAMSTLLFLLRPVMLRRKPSALSTEDGSEIDLRVAMARQYIADNIELHPTIEEVAAYCYLGTKQLTRLFLCAEGMTLNAYIREQKIAHIRRLLSDSDLPLSEISDRMQFSSEYYFNTYFKSHTGMTPGKYRQMMKG